MPSERTLRRKRAEQRAIANPVPVPRGRPRRPPVRLGQQEPTQPHTAAVAQQQPDFGATPAGDIPAVAQPSLELPPGLIDTIVSTVTDAVTRRINPIVAPGVPAAAVTTQPAQVGPPYPAPILVAEPEVIDTSPAPAASVSNSSSQSTDQLVHNAISGTLPISPPSLLPSQLFQSCTLAVDSRGTD